MNLNLIPASELGGHSPRVPAPRLTYSSSGDEGILNPRRTAEMVAKRAEHVTINSTGIKKLAKMIYDNIIQDGFSLSQWRAHPLHPDTADEAAINWIFLTDCLNFSFWPDSEEQRFIVSYKGVPYTGYFALCAALNRALYDDHIPVTSAQFMADVTLDQVRHILRVDQDGLEMPLLEKRVEVMRQAGRALLDKFKGSFVTAVKSAKGSAQALLWLTVENFESFKDECSYHTDQIGFYKRAQILIADIWGCFEGKGLGRFLDIDSLTMFADYRVPQVLAYFDALTYSDHLKDLLVNQQSLEFGDPIEVEIRSLSILAVEHLREEIVVLDQSAQEATDQLDTSTAGPILCNSIVIDFYLWSYRRDHAAEIERKVPFHRCRSIFY